MKRDIIVGKLLAEGLSEKTLVRLNDNQLLALAERMLSEEDVMISKKDPQFQQKVAASKKLNKTIETYEQELKGGQKKLDKNHNGKIDGQDFKILKGQKKSSKKCDDCGKEVKDCKCDQSHLEESPKFGKKVTKGHNGIPEFMDSKKLKGKSEKSQVKEWVEKLVENQYHSFTSKNEIMELIQVKLTENQPAPSKPTREAPVREKPSTKPEKPSRENPFEPKHKPKPKALGEENNEEAEVEIKPKEPKIEPKRKAPFKDNPFKPKHSPKPKALGEEGMVGNKPKMPEFMKAKNLGFKFKDQK